MAVPKTCRKSTAPAGRVSGHYAFERLLDRCTQAAHLIERHFRQAVKLDDQPNVVVLFHAALRTTATRGSFQIVFGDGKKASPLTTYRTFRRRLPTRTPWQITEERLQ
jgi:hypothetical protein